jgi:hypothetical protein
MRQSRRVRGARAFPLHLLLIGIAAGCEPPAGEGRADARGPAPRPSVASAERSPSRPWPRGLSERESLIRLRSHYHEAARVARAIQGTASSKAVRDEAGWLVKVYDHVGEHFETSLREWYGAVAVAEPDPPLHEFTDPGTISDVRERERRFAGEVVENHRRLLEFVKRAEYEEYASKRPLLQEIRLDVETSQATQVDAFEAAVLASAGP